MKLSRAGKFIRKITSLIIVAGAVLITLYVWGIIERHPRTDDATARANVVGIAPRVAGQILKLNVQDNQAVKEGDVLFEIDPEDYSSCWKRPKLDFPLWIDRLKWRAQDQQLKFGVKAAEAGVQSADAQLKRR